MFGINNKNQSNDPAAQASQPPVMNNSNMPTEPYVPVKDVISTSTAAVNNTPNNSTPPNDYVSPYLSNFTLYENPTNQSEPTASNTTNHVTPEEPVGNINEILKTYTSDIEQPSPVINAKPPQITQTPITPMPEVTQQTNQILTEPQIPTVDNVSPQNKVLNGEELNMVENKIGEQLSNSMSDSDLDIKNLLDLVIDNDGSDLHLTVGYPVMIRIDSELERAGDPLTAEQVKKIIDQTLTTNQKELLEINKEVDLSYAHEDKARFRVNAYYQKGEIAASYRLIPTKIKSIEELLLPPQLYDFTRLSQGLFLLTGPTGSGKSTTLAAMVQEINENQSVHVITIEDPIEYVYPKSKALVDQRELGTDTHDWNIALKSILRQDPDVILIGEMRDYETIQSALTIAETGHLVFATLHTNSAAESIDRIVDVFPSYQQAQIRLQLASTLKGVLSQRLVPKIGGGRECATELMIVNNAIQNLIRDGKSYQIDNVISTSFDIGMTTLERSLVKKVREGKISVETAMEYSIRPKDILKLMRSN